MRNTLSFTSVCAVIIIMLFSVSCKKDINERTANFPALAPSDVDIEGGSWKLVLLDSAGAVPLAAPVATNSPGYISDLNEIKQYQKSISGDQSRIVDYWKAGSVLRWNEILRELVAKYNIPPYQNPDRTYSFPSAANPLAYPLFPFSNPPYAARAYAYVAAAQYDALVAAWHYKKMYNRSAPYIVDSSVRSLIPRSSLPSYPSEDAVVAGASVEMLKLLFPGDVEYVQQKADEEKLYRIIAGANVRSEIEAGEDLGRLVAQKFTSRARTDKAGAAIGNPAFWKLLEDQTLAKGEISWISLELPKRPPMLPLFSKVKPFLTDSLGIIGLRPPPPPSTSSDQFKQETAEILAYTNNPTREHTAIVHFWADGAGTYTPPGHWDAIASEEFVKQNYSELRWARNLALINMSLMDAAIVCWDAKYFYFNPRPSQADEFIKTLTGVPNFPAYTSGHATFSAAAATVLSHILPDQGTKFIDMAKEASISRMYGGIHFKSDCDAGFDCGLKVGALAISRAQTDGAE